MLQKLYIENIAVIERAEIDFSGGFNVLTGETGAGKSILIDSICAVLGERTSRELIRTGAQSACVSAVFCGLGRAAEEKLCELGLCTEEGALTLGRELRADGRGVYRVNGRPCGGGVLREIGRLLINIHGQHDTQALMDPSRHLGYLDSMLPDPAVLERYRADYERFCELDEKYSKACSDQDAKARRVDLLNFRIDEIDSAQLYEGEYEELCEKRRMFQNFERISVTLGDVDSYLHGAGDSLGCASELEQAVELLGDLSECYADIKPLSDRLYSLSVDLRDAADEIHEMYYGMEYDEDEQERVEQRLELLRRIIKKYGGIPQALSFSRKAKIELQNLVVTDEQREKLEQERAQALAQAQAAADALSAERRRAAKDFCTQIKSELEYLDLPSVSFEVSFGTTELSAYGADSAEFLLSANPGEPPKPLAKTASGGELSRIMLAIKNVMAGKDDIDTLIFDEVDAGISGRAAHKVGVKLSQTAGGRQIICVTHLAQIAAFADNHLFIEKFVRGGRTFTQVRSLGFEERVYELARINSGENVTDSMLNTAREMLIAGGNNPE